MPSSWNRSAASLKITVGIKNLSSICVLYGFFAAASCSQWRAEPSQFMMSFFIRAAVTLLPWYVFVPDSLLSNLDGC